VERKALFGRAETERLPPEAYSTDVSARIYATLRQKAERIIAAGHSAVVDAVFARASERQSVADIAQSHGIRFQGLFLTAPLETRLARVGTRGPDASDADARIAQAQESYDLGPIGWSLIDASGTPEGTLRRSRAAISERA
jgi:predicted kinase